MKIANTKEFEQGVLARAKQLMSRDELEAHIQAMAERVNAELTEPQHVICVLTGGIVFTGRVLDLFNFPVTLDYVHATRYRGETSGEEIEWIVTPKQSMKDQEVLILDDIYDVGTTVKAIVDACYQQGAKIVRTAMMVNKVHNRKADPAFKIDYIACDMPDEYLFGSGMDYKNLLRNADGIYAAAAEDI